MAPLLGAIVAILLFGGSGWLWYSGHWVSAIPVSFVTFVVGALSYTGFRVQQSVSAATQTAYDLVGTHAEKVSDAIVERVKKV